MLFRSTQDSAAKFLVLGITQNALHALVGIIVQPTQPTPGDYHVASDIIASLDQVMRRYVQEAISVTTQHLTHMDVQV